MSDRQPNILFLFTDQQRYDTIAELGNPMIRTPALDRLAREGTAFTQAFTPSPVCMAARCAVVTGQPPHRTGCTANNPMPQDETSFMQRLSEQGYQTAGIGKMHFSPDPYLDWGFEQRIYSEEGATPGDEFMAYLDEQGYGHVHDVHGVRGEYYYLPQPSQLPAEHHHTHWIADRSIDLLKDRDRDRPFFLWASFIKPHPPFENPTPWNKLYRAPEMRPPFRPGGYENLLNFWNRIQNRYKYRDAGIDDNLMRTMRAAYYAAISFIDYNVGRILEALGDEIDNTLIVYSADHGELLGDYGSVGKRSMLDAGARVPLLVRYPEQFTAGARVDAPTTLLDIWPTLLAAAGADEIYSSEEGEALQRVANGSTERKLVFSQFSEGRFGLYMVTDGRYKYIYSAADEKEWLLDRKNDPSESHNFAYNLTYHDVTARLRRALLARFEADEYDIAVADGEWRRYGKQTLPDDPDFGLLFQDPPSTQTHINALGPYARQVTVPDSASYAAFAHLARDD
jgi:arylsulfatase